MDVRRHFYTCPSLLDTLYFIICTFLFFVNQPALTPSLPVLLLLFQTSGRVDAAAEALATAARLAGAPGDSLGKDGDEGGFVGGQPGGGGVDAPPVPVAPMKSDDELVHSEFGYSFARLLA